MRKRLVFGLMAILAGARCSTEAEKPPPITCSGACGPIHWPPVIHDPPSGEGGAGGASGGENDEPLRLVGDIARLDDIAGLRWSPLREPAELRVEGRRGDVTGRYDGINPFSIDGVLRTSTNWVLVTPGPADVLPTLQGIDTRADDANELDTELTVVSASELDSAFSVISLPVMRDAARAQAVLVAHRNQSGVPGVSVRTDAAEAVIYVDGGSFSDTATATDASGVVILANLPATTGSVTVTLSGMMSSSSLNLRVVAGGVTFAGISD